MREVCQFYVLHSRNLTLCLLTVPSFGVLGIMKARVGKTISLHAKHEVGNSGLSVPGPNDGRCNYSRVQRRESVSTDSITHSCVSLTERCSVLGTCKENYVQRIPNVGNCKFGNFQAIEFQYFTVSKQLILARMKKASKQHSCNQRTLLH